MSLCALLRSICALNFCAIVPICPIFSMIREPSGWSLFTAWFKFQLNFMAGKPLIDDANRFQNAPWMDGDLSHQALVSSLTPSRFAHRFSRRQIRARSARRIRTILGKPGHVHPNIRDNDIALRSAASRQNQKRGARSGCRCHSCNAFWLSETSGAYQGKPHFSMRCLTIPDQYLSNIFADVIELEAVSVFSMFSSCIVYLIARTVQNLSHFLKCNIYPFGLLHVLWLTFLIAHF